MMNDDHRMPELSVGLGCQVPNGMGTLNFNISICAKKVMSDCEKLPLALGLG